MPIAASHRLEAAVVARTALAALCFCLVASGVHVLNDLLDLAADRAHPVRCDRGGSAIAGRGYRVGDLPAIAALTAAAGYGAALVFALYVSSPEVRLLYRTPELLWTACPVLLAWISRVILLAMRGELHHDPVVFALTDRVSLLTGMCFAAVLAAAI